MSATQLVLDNIIAAIGGAGLLLTGLSAYIGKRISDRSNIAQKASFDMEILNLQNTHASSMKLIEKNMQIELAKKDQFHQISKGTFEKIFELKIEIYTDLLKLKVEFFEFLDESHILDVGIDDPTDEFYSLFMRCRKHLELNKLYISDELSRKYDLWHIKAMPFFKKANIESFNAYELASDESERYQNILEAQNPVFSEMIQNTMNEMKDILIQIEKDISIIRSNIDAPMRHLST